MMDVARQRDYSGDAKRGIDQARERGTKSGRPLGNQRALTDAQRQAVVTLRASGMSIADVIESTGLSRATVFRVLADARQTG